MIRIIIEIDDERRDSLRDRLERGNRRPERDILRRIEDEPTPIRFGGGTLRFPALR